MGGGGASFLIGMGTAGYVYIGAVGEWVIINHLQNANGSKFSRGIPKFACGFSEDISWKMGTR